MYRQYKAEGLAVIGVGINWSPTHDCAGWAEERRLSYPLLDDTDSTIFNLFVRNDVPFNVIIDHRMRLRYALEGFGADIGDTLTKLLAELPAVGVAETITTPASFRLEALYPNPFNSATTITYFVPYTTEVRLTVYDMRGAEVAVLVSGREVTGEHEVMWDATGLSNGIYLVRLSTTQFRQTRKTVLLK